MPRGPQLLVPLLAAAALLLLVVYYAGSTLRLQVLELPPLRLAATAAAASRCGPSAAARGARQRVAAFSFYGAVHHARGYFQGIARNAAAVARLYPGWTMRLYHDVPPASGSSVSRELDRLSREFPHLDLCYVGDVPGYGDLRGRQQNAWRFLAMADPLVDVFISRDLDALPLEREADAVAEWLESNATFHVMRDHPWHANEIMGDVWQHDSYHCQKYASHGHMRPFPTRRNQTVAYNFVGNRVGVDTKPMIQTCPAQCRPAQHPDWLYC